MKQAFLRSLKDGNFGCLLYNLEIRAKFVAFFFFLVIIFYFVELEPHPTRFWLTLSSIDWAPFICIFFTQSYKEKEFYLPKLEYPFKTPKNLHFKKIPSWSIEIYNFYSSLTGEFVFLGLE